MAPYTHILLCNHTNPCSISMFLSITYLTYLSAVYLSPLPAYLHVQSHPSNYLSQSLTPYSPITTSCRLASLPGLPSFQPNAFILIGSPSPARPDQYDTESHHRTNYPNSPTQASPSAWNTRNVDLCQRSARVSLRPLSTIRYHKQSFSYSTPQMSPAACLLHVQLAASLVATRPSLSLC